MQGVIRVYDPQTARRASWCATPTAASTPPAPDALEGSLFRMLRQGQRVVFELDDDGRATHVRLGSEPDMGLPTAEV